MKLFTPSKVIWITTSVLLILSGIVIIDILSESFFEEEYCERGTMVTNVETCGMLSEICEITICTDGTNTWLPSTKGGIFQ